MLGADGYGYIRPPRPPDSKKQEWLDRLADWENELQTNRCGMQKVAQRCVDLLKAEIAEFWPDST